MIETIASTLNEKPVNIEVGASPTLLLWSFAKRIQPDRGQDVSTSHDPEAGQGSAQA
jgi:hypothetical protein